MIEQKNIEKVVKNELCTGCGGCAGVCPSAAVAMKLDRRGNLIAVVDADACCNCGLCLRVCSGIGFDYAHLMNEIHGKLPENKMIGPAIKTCVGYTKDREVLEKAQSGGIVSEMLIYGIENHLFDGAVVTSYRDDDPFMPEVSIARSREEILKATGSKYCSVPAASIIKELMSMDGHYAFVGTPCQIHSMRKAEELWPKLKEKIALYIGLHCIGVYSYNYIEYLLDSIKIERSEIAEFQYKKKMQGENAPASTVVLSTKTGKEIKLPGGKYRLSQKPYFTNWRCHLCYDKLNELSDLSCGDCRIMLLYREQEKAGVRTGLSDIIVRTERGFEYLERLVRDSLLDIRHSEERDLISTTKVAEKKLGVRYASKINSVQHRDSPEYGIQFSIGKRNYEIRLRTFFSLLAMGYNRLSHQLTAFEWYRVILVKIPPKILYYTNFFLEYLTIEYKYKGSCELVTNINQDHEIEDDRNE